MKLVIFDCDGTLIDSQHNITAAMAFAFERHGLVAPSRHDILSVVGLSLTEAFAQLAPLAAVDVRRSLAEHYRDAFGSGHIQRDAEPLYPGIRQTIDTLAARDDVILGIATGKSRRGVARLLGQEGWEGRFFTIQTADDHPSKPHPSMILTALAETGIAPDSAVMVGDTTFDMAMALAAGVGALGVSWGYHRTERLMHAGAHDVVDEGGRLIEAIEDRLRRQLALQESKR